MATIKFTPKYNSAYTKILKDSYDIKIKSNDYGSPNKSVDYRVGKNTGFSNENKNELERLKRMK